MTKEKMLRSMMTENQFIANRYGNMRLKKAVIEEAFRIYNTVSHIQSHVSMARYQIPARSKTQEIGGTT